LEAQPGQVLQYLSRYIQRPISYNTGAAETVGYDAATKTAVFSDGAANKITFLNMTNPAAPTKVRDVLLNAYSGRINSVAVRGGIVAVALEDATAKTNPGQVVFFDINGTFRSSVQVGALPDMLTFTPDGTKVIVCNEGEPNDAYTIDPEGSVSVISIASITAPTVTNIGFTSLNGRQDSLRALGIRIYGPNATVAQDFEPEYVAVSADSRTAWVTLQENNALAIIDLTTNALVRVVALGFKDYSQGLPTVEQAPWATRPVLGITPAGDTIRLGGFSGLWFEGYGSTSNKLIFLTHPDRGPNAEPTVIRGQTRRPFALPNYQAEVVRFEYDRVAKSFTILNRIPLTRQDGVTPISGRPNLQAAGQGIAYTDEFGVDLYGNDIPNDPLGGDLEGIVKDGAGTFWLVDEYRPAIYNFQSNGTLIDRYVAAGTAAAVAAPAGTYGVEALPSVYAKRRNNRGFEAVAIDGTKLYAFIQSPIDNPDVSNDANSRAATFGRILEFDIVTKTVTGEYLYPFFEANFACDKIGDAVALGGGRFMVVERDDAKGLNARKYLFEIDLQGATNLIATPPVLPPGRTIESLRFVELATYGIKAPHKFKRVYLPGAGYGDFDKVEGLARIDATTWALINDNDFGVGGSTLPAVPNGSITVDKTSIPVLGLLTFSRPNGLDPSDRDNANLINQWPVYGMYQPDAIEAITVGGKTYLVTANEGDAREYAGFVEEKRFKDVTLDPVLWPNGATQKLDANLGRLNITTALGDQNNDGLLDRAYTLGGRSISVWNTEGNLIWDSGNELETKTAALWPSNFNCGNTTNARDDRSDNKGPEPEGITAGVINDSVYVFACLERIGHTVMYNMSNITSPKFIDIINSRGFSATLSDTTQIGNGTVGDLGAEVVKFISNTESGNNTDYVIAANEVTGTVSTYQVRIPRINSIPAALINACIGDQLVLTVAATGPSLVFQWSKNSVDIPGATSATYSIPVSGPTVAGTYQCRVTAAGGMTIAPRATTVNVFKRTRIITEPPALLQRDSSAYVEVPFVASDSAGETYRWYRAGTALNNGSKYQGVTTNRLRITDLRAADTSSRYYCIVTGGCSTVQTRNVSIQMPRVIITTNPVSQFACPGDTVYLSAAALATGGDRGLSYQWRINGQNLPETSHFRGTQSPTLRIVTAQRDDSGEYTCLIKGTPSLEATLSAPAQIVVDETPVITKQPAGINGTQNAPLCEGQGYSVSVRATAPGEINYQWNRNGMPILGANKDQYTTVQPGVFTCSVSGRCSVTTVTTQSVNVIRIVEPLIALQPAELTTIREGQSVSLTFTLRQGSPELEYQWYHDNIAIPGAINSTFTIASAKTEDAGIYYCTIRNACGSVTTWNSTVRVLTDDPTSVDEQDENQLTMTVDPMPVEQEAVVRFTMAASARATVDVLDVTGRVVVTVHDGELSAGPIALRLRAVEIGPSGYYTVRLRTAGRETAQPFLLRR
jgi:hypothetical protein